MEVARPISDLRFLISHLQFPVSSLQFRISPVSDLLLGLLFCLLVAGACSRHEPRRVREPSGREVAARVRSLVRTAGGGQIWIKPSGNSRIDPPLQAVANPAGYHAVLSALQQESRRGTFRLGVTIDALAEGRSLAILRISQHGQNLLQVHLREVPRLMRAVIVIDDLGADLTAAHKLLALNYPLTFSILPYLRYTRETAQEAHRRGREVMLHLPMQPESAADASPGRGAIWVGMRGPQVQQVVQDDLAAVPYVAGVNNHMGSRATQDAALMADVMVALADHRVYFVDSRTTPRSTALEEARRHGLPAFYRAVFLDNTETVDYTLHQLREFRRRVQLTGVALAIGHPHATTISALKQFLPEFDRADIELMPASALMRLPEVARLSPHEKVN